jgi:hypothetical protein
MLYGMTSQLERDTNQRVAFGCGDTWRGGHHCRDPSVLKCIEEINVLCINDQPGYNTQMYTGA